MAVAKSVTVVPTSGTGVSSFANFMTVGASDTFLLVGISVDGAVTINAPVWDSGGTNQTMTSLGTVVTDSTGTQETVGLYGLVNPTPGLKTLKLNASASGNAYATNHAATGANITVTSAAVIPSGDMAVAVANNINGFTNAFTAGTNPGDGGVAIGKNQNLTTNMAAEYYSGAGSTITTTIAQGASGGFVVALVGIKAAGGGAASPVGKIYAVKQSIIRAAFI